MMLQGWTRWLCCCCVCLPLWLHGAERPVALAVVGPAAPQVQAFSSALKAALPTQCQLLSAPEPDSLLIALGDQAFRQHLAHPGPLLGVYVSRAELTSARAAGCRCSGIYREASAASQVALLRLLFPDARRIGVLRSNTDPDLESFFPPGYLLEQHQLPGVRPLAAQLTELLPDIDVLLVMPSLALIEPTDARLLLLGSYRQRVPLIGPDAAFVESGSLASTYPSQAALIETTLSMLEQWMAEQRLPPPRYAAPTVLINQHVARSYGVQAKQQQLQTLLEKTQ